MTNAITTPTISSVVNKIQISSSFEVHDAGMIITGVPTLEEWLYTRVCGCRVRVY